MSFIPVLLSRSLSPVARAAFAVALIAGCAAGPEAPLDGGHHTTVHTGSPSDGAAPADASTTTSPDSAPTMPPPPRMRALEELCGNGLDDNNNGLIDDGCACIPEQSQRCYGGDPSQAGVGQCTWGHQHCSGSEIGTWDTCTDFGGPSTEICDGIDNNCDGRIDEGCPCMIGEARHCYDGPPGTENVGTCHGGMQRCEMEGVSAGWGACTGTVTPQPELCDHMDHDCNGHVDENCYCPNGATPTFRRPQTGGGSGILPPGSTLLDMTCENGRCPPGQAAVANDPSAPNSFVCVPIPPPCTAGHQLDLQMGMLTCVQCDVIVQFGALYGNLRVCAPPPGQMCPPGEVPTFVYESRSWQCRPTCDNGQYDQHHIGAMLVCIPC